MTRVNPEVHVITLAVDDLQRSLAFYRDGLGLPSEGITAEQFVDEHSGAAGAVVMFHLADGLVLALYPRSELAKDAGVSPERTSGSGFSIAQHVGCAADVDRVLDLAARSGGEVPGPARQRPWGIYSGYFSDPDGHLWEIMHLPGRD